MADARRSSSESIVRSMRDVISSEASGSDSPCETSTCENVPWTNRDLTCENVPWTNRDLTCENVPWTNRDLTCENVPWTNRDLTCENVPWTNRDLTCENVPWTNRDLTYVLPNTSLRKVSSPHHLELDSINTGWSFSMATPTCQRNVTTTEEDSMMTVTQESCEKIRHKVILRPSEKSVPRTLFPTQAQMGTSAGTPAVRSHLEHCAMSPIPFSPLVKETSTPNMVSKDMSVSMFGGDSVLETTPYSDSSKAISKDEAHVSCSQELFFGTPVPVADPLQTEPPPDDILDVLFMSGSQLENELKKRNEAENLAPSKDHSTGSLVAKVDAKTSEARSDCVVDTKALREPPLITSTPVRHKANSVGDVFCKPPSTKKRRVTIKPFMYPASRHLPMTRKRHNPPIMDRDKTPPPAKASIETCAERSNRCHQPHPLETSIIKCLNVEFTEAESEATKSNFEARLVPRGEKADLQARARVPGLRRFGGRRLTPDSSEIGDGFLQLKGSSFQLAEHAGDTTPQKLLAKETASQSNQDAKPLPAAKDSSVPLNQGYRNNTTLPSFLPPSSAVCEQKAAFKTPDVIHARASPVTVPRRAVSAKRKPFKAPRKSSGISKAEDKAAVARILGRFRAAGAKRGGGTSIELSSACGEKPAHQVIADSHPLQSTTVIETRPDQRILAGFCTASGKNLSITSAALTRAQTMVSDMSSDDPGPLPHVEPQATEPLLTGFKTGSGKSLLVTSAALTKAKSRFSDDPGPLPHAEPQATEPLLTGFKTGSGKSLLVTSAALTRAKSRFSDDPGPLPHAEPQATEPLLTGFKTGSGKSLLVTSAALTRAKSRFSDDPGPLPHAEPQATEPLLTGFKTGSGKSLLVTSAALTRAKSRFSDDPGPLPHAEPQATEPLLTGFKTGSGKSLLVTSAALTRVKSRFSDDPGPLPHAEQSRFSIEAESVVERPKEGNSLLTEFQDNPISPKKHQTDHLVQLKDAVELQGLDEFDLKGFDVDTFVDFTQINFETCQHDGESATDSSAKSPHGLDYSTPLKSLEDNDYFTTQVVRQILDFSFEEENSPTESLHNSPTESSHNSPTESLHNSPTESSHNSPTESLHNSPTESSHNSPTESSHNSPTESSHNSPTESSHNSPTEPSHNSPTEPSHNSPTESLHNSPTAGPEDDSIIDHLFEMASKQLPDGVTTAVAAPGSYQPELLTSGEPLNAPEQSEQQGLSDSSPTDWTAYEAGDLLGKRDVADESKRNTEIPPQASEHLSIPTESCPAKLQPTSEDVKFPGLQTASGKQVHVSAKAHSIAQNTLSSTEDNQPCQTASGPLSETSFPGLQTASGPLSETPRCTSTFPGLQTASGQTVEVAQESLAQVRLVLGSSDGNSSEQQTDGECQDEAINHSVKETVSFPGFQTASGRKVNVSKDSLEAVRKTIHEEGNMSALPRFPGFMTGKGEQVAISETTLKAARVTLNQEEAQCDVPVGLMTASGSAVEVSKRSLEAVKVILDQSNHTDKSHDTGSFTAYKSSDRDSATRYTPVDETTPVVQAGRKYKPVFKAQPSIPVDETTPVVQAGRKYKPVFKAQPSTPVDETTPVVQAGRKYKPVFKAGGLTKSDVSQAPVARSQAPRGIVSTHSQAPRGILSTPEGILFDRAMPRGKQGLVPLQSYLNSDGSYISATPIPRYPNSKRRTTVRAIPPYPTRPLLTTPYRLTYSRPLTRCPPQQLPLTPLWRASAQGKASLKNSHSSRLQADAGEKMTSHITKTSTQKPSASDLLTPLSPINISLSQLCAMDCSLTDDVLPGATKLSAEDSGYHSKNQTEATSPGVSDPLTPGQGTKSNIPAFDCTIRQVDLTFAETAKESLNDSLEEEDNKQTVGNSQTPVRIISESQTTTGLKVIHHCSPAKQCPIKPHMGSLLSIKLQHSHCRVPLQAVVGHRAPGRYSLDQLFSLGVHPAVARVSVSNAREFSFTGSQYFSTSVQDGAPVCIGDGAVLRLKDGRAGVDELGEAFLSSRGVDPELVSREWFVNHYKWVVWKLAAMEVAFPLKFASRCLTPDWVMLEIKYRYDREIDRAERPAIRKICERDDVASRTMVLCISGIHRKGLTVSSNESKSDVEPCIELSDGWYSLPAVLDPPLKQMLGCGKISVGTKLVISGAELTGDNEPCHPLEAPSNLALKISANSTRRARWYAKLGYQRLPRPFPISLSSVYPDGGLVGCTEVVVARVYPMLYMEKIRGGGNIFRASRAEERVAGSYEAVRQQRMEVICGRVEREFWDEIEKEEHKPSTRRRSRRLNVLQIKQLQDGEEVYNALLSAPDPVAFQELLSKTQCALLESYRQTLISQRQAELQHRIRQALEDAEDELPPVRTVVRLLRVRLVPVGGMVFDCQLTVWRPSEATCGELREGRALRLFNVTASAGRFKHSHRLQLTATRSTVYEPITAVTSSYVPRQCLPIVNVATTRLAYGEFDTVGVVVCYMTANIPTKDSSTKQVDTVYLSDAEGCLLAIKIWDGLKSYAIEGLVTPGSLLSVSNLSYRDHGHRLPTASASDITTFSQNPQDIHLKNAITELKEKLPVERKKFLQSLEDEVTNSFL